eukprot:scaffold26132_cov159-Isochrysis_galbana.AAC.1
MVVKRVGEEELSLFVECGKGGQPCFVRVEGWGGFPSTSGIMPKTPGLWSRGGEESDKRSDGLWTMDYFWVPSYFRPVCWRRRSAPLQPIQSLAPA